MVRTKTLLFIAGIFLVIFLFPYDIVLICLCPTYQMMMALIKKLTDLHTMY